MEKKQEKFGWEDKEDKEELTEEEKTMLVVEEEVKILLDRLHTIADLFSKENVEKFSFWENDPELREKISFILEVLREIERKIVTFRENGEKITKHNFFQDRIGNFAEIVSLSFKRIASFRKNKQDLPSDLPEILLIKKYVGNLFDYLKKLKNDPLLLEDEINRSWEKEKK